VKRSTTDYAVTVWWQAWTKTYSKMFMCMGAPMYDKKRRKELVDGGQRSVCLGVWESKKKKDLLLQTGETELAGNQNIGNTVRT